MKHILAGYAAAALLAAFFPVLHGRLPIPSEAALPWLPGANATAVNPQLSDGPTQILPWSRSVAESYRRGRLPLRDQSSGCGMALWANPQAQAAAPTSVLLLLFPLPWATAAAAALKLFLAATGTYLLLWHRAAVSRLAAAWGGTAFGFSLYLGFWMDFPETYPVALLPWALLAMDRLACAEGGAFGPAVLVIALLLLGGHPENELYVALATVAVFALRLAGEPVAAREKALRAGKAAAAALLAVGLTAAYTVPVAIAISRSERSAQAAAALAGRRPSLDVGDFFKPPVWWKSARFFLVPEAQGNPRDGDAFGAGYMASRAGGYAGILTLGFAVGSLLWPRAPRGVRWGRIALVLFPPYLFVYRPLQALLWSLPGIAGVALRLGVNQSVLVLNLLLAFLAVRQLDRLDNDAAARGIQRVVLGALALGVAVLGIRFRFAHAEIWTAWRAGSFLLPLAILGAAIACLAGVWTPARRRTLAVIVLAGTAAELLRIDARFDPGTRPEDHFPQTAEIRELQRLSSGGRFATSGATMSGLATMYGLADVRAHDPMTPKAYEDLLRATAGYTGPDEYFARVRDVGAPVLSLLNVRAVLSADGTTVVPRPGGFAATFPDRLVSCRDSGEVLRALSAEREFERAAYALGEGATFAGRAEVVSFEHPVPERIRIRVRCDTPRLLLVSESNDGGWTAAAAGRALPTSVVDNALLGVRVPAGETEITCEYRPPGFHAGLALSAATGLLVGVLALAGRMRRRRQA
jgi:Bacterial membrane protein YfhO